MDSLAGFPFDSKSLEALPRHLVTLPSFYLCLLFIAFTLLLQTRTGNYSWVDRFWPILPTIYTATHVDHLFSAQFLFTLAWGIRLTYNQYRRQGYELGFEDYRWKVISDWCDGLRGRETLSWKLFAVLFIAIFQNFLLWAITFPSLYTPENWNWLNLGALVGFIIFFILEMEADNQVWAFHSDAQRKREEDFIQTGLFRYSRHPNYLGELGMWWCLYFLSVPKLWTALGPMLLTGLMNGSTSMTEYVSSRKYYRYRYYQRITSRILPWFPSDGKPGNLCVHGERNHSRRE